MPRLFLLLILLLPGAAWAQVPAPGRVVGTVTDAATAAPLPGVNVVLTHGAIALGGATDAEGRFAIDRVPPGPYRLEAHMVGYGAARREVEVGAGETLDVTLALGTRTYGLDEVVVRATRMELPLSAVSGAVTVVDGAALREQTTTSEGLGEALGKVVPGLGVATGSPSIYGQSLRGRTISVLIDGVPQSTTRNTSRDLATIDPSLVERVEVIRGATSLYGDGATGGIINIITRRPVTSGTRFTTTVEGGGAVTAPGDGLEGRFTQTATGRHGSFDYTAGATVRRTNGFYDAAGDLIPPDPYGQGGYASTTSLALNGRLGWMRGGHRLQLTTSHLDAFQETSYVSDASVNALPAGEAKARAVRGLDMEDPQGSRNTLASLDYDHGDALGGRVHAQLFWRDYLTRFNPFDGRPYAGYQAIIQSRLESEKLGVRLEHERALHEASELTLLAGFDFTDERTQQPVAIMDPEIYDASGGLTFRAIDDRPWVPLMNPRSLGLFAQLAWQPLARLDLQGGVRYERARLHIDDFTTLVGNEVTGGTVAYDPLLVNLGAVVHTTDRTEVYASFSQGFSLTDLGLLLRGVGDGFVVGERTLKAQKVNGVELGARGTWAGVQASASAFYNESDLGTTSAGLDRGVVRAPEQVYGVEATLDVQPAGPFGVGGTFTWTEGENDADEDGVYLPLNTYRIQPLKVTGHVTYAPRPGWSSRLQLLYSGQRDRAFEERLDPSRIGFGERAVDDYLVLDLTTTLPLGPGALTAGVANLLNRQYFPVVSQLMWNGANSSRAAAPGARLTLGYTVTY